MHPASDIQGTRSDLLKDRRIVLGITGSIAAVECVKLARELIRHGAEVHAVMTPKACEIIHPYAMEFATGNKVVTELTGMVEHVSMCGDVEGRADLILIAPCTANTLGKMVHAIDDTPVTTFLTTAIGTGIPVIIVPAMHNTMYDHPKVRENLEKARGMGVDIIEPVIEEKKAKMAPIPVIVEQVIRALSTGRLKGKKVLVVTGATSEPIDDMRSVTNKASGKTGVYIGLASFREGADLMLLAGENVKEIPLHLSVERFSTTSSLISLVEGLENGWGSPDVAFFCAGISDYAPTVAEGKIPSGEEELIVRMRRTPKVIELFKVRFPGCYLVGWKAESVHDPSDLMKKAYKRLKEVGMDLVVANDLSSVTTESNSIVLITPEKEAFKVEGDKKDIADFVIEKVLERMKGKGS